VLESAGIEAALKWLARQIETDYGLQIAFSDDLQDKTVARERQIELYNCVRELLINVAKHAGTTTACLSVCRVADTLVIRVEDDGVGFDTEAIFTNSDGDGFGLFTISRRVTHMGGIFQITSKQGSGTEITMNVPLAAMSIPDTAAGE
jgi:signal transduction histidine kinase